MCETIVTTIQCMKRHKHIWPYTFVKLIITCQQHSMVCDFKKGCCCCTRSRFICKAPCKPKARCLVMTQPAVALPTPNAVLSHHASRIMDVAHQPSSTPPSPNILGPKLSQGRISESIRNYPPPYAHFSHYTTAYRTIQYHRSKFHLDRRPNSWLRLHPSIIHPARDPCWPPLFSCD